MQCLGNPLFVAGLELKNIYTKGEQLSVELKENCGTLKIIDNKKEICEVLVTSQFNKDKSTIKVNEGQKMTEVTRTSTPKNNKVYPDCRIKLSPIQNPVHSTTVQPSFSEHADISDKRNASKLNLYSDDSNSDESDYEDNIPLKVVQEGLNAMSGESPICSRTINTNCHDLMSQYDWMKLNKKFIQCAMWEWS